MRSGRRDRPPLWRARDRRRRPRSRVRGTSAARARSRFSRSCLPRAATTFRPTRLAELLWGDRAAGRCRRLDPDVHLGSAPPPRHRPRSRTPDRRHGGRGVPLRDRHVELDLDRFDELLERSAKEPTRAARQIAGRRARARARRRPRGRAVHVVGRRLARHLPWSRPRRAPRRRRRRARRARLLSCRSTTARQRSRSIASANAPIGRRVLALYALGDAHRALDELPRLQTSARRGARARAVGETRVHSRRRSCAKRSRSRCCRGRSRRRPRASTPVDAAARPRPRAEHAVGCDPVGASTATSC